MAALSANVVTRSGFAPNFVAVAAGGDTFTPGDDVFLHVKNANAGACVVTVPAPGNVRGVAINSFTISVPATTGDREFGPFPSSLFAGSSGVASISYSVSASVTIQVKRYPTS